SLADELAAVARAAEEGEPSAVEILDKSARRMAGAVSVLTNLLDVECVVFGGPFWSALAPVYLSKVPALVAALSVTTSVHSVEIAGTRLTSGEEAFGAACLVLEK